MLPKTFFLEPKDLTKELFKVNFNGSKASFVTKSSSFTAISNYFRFVICQHRADARYFNFGWGRENT